MSIKSLRLLCAAMVLGCGSVAVAETADPAVDAIRKSLEVQLPNSQVDSIVASAIPGLYEVTLGARVFYMSADGRYLVAGDMTDLSNGVNLTEQKVAAAVKAAMDKVADSDYIKFGPDDAKYSLVVFTDIDCGYCRKLHSEIEGYNKEGIQVKYLAFPRGGLMSESFAKAEAVWCAADRKAAITQAKGGKAVPVTAGCKSPVKSQYELGQAIGISGTPALVLPDGTVLPGYLPPAKLKAHLDETLAKK